MPLKRHHKIIIGGFGTIVIVYMFVTAILLNGAIIKQELNYNDVLKKINDVKSSQTETQSKLNELTENLIETQKSLNLLDESLNSKLKQIKASTSADFSGIIEDSLKSVVTIRTDVAQGTGFIISDEGYIVTNAHVLSGGRQLEVLDYEQDEHPTELIGYNITLDIALLKISGNYNSLELGDSNDVQIGEKVIAIGNPLGLQFSVSEGIVSAINREGSNGLKIYIQTDAALNPGNSGGPLINKQGEVIGINNFKIGSSESLGFALESNYIKEVVNQISQEEYGMNLI
ncbi:MAG: trypsin-like peptidase domain-containing protein [Nanoarchaeota archaeon]